MFHKVQAVEPLSEYRLMVRFVSGESRQYDVKPLMERWEAFRSLSQIDRLFEQVKVDAGGYGVSWNDDIDLSCDELYENGVQI